MAGLLSSHRFALRRRSVRIRTLACAVTTWAALLAVAGGVLLSSFDAAQAQPNFLTFRDQLRPTPPATGNSGSFAKQALNPGAAASAANQGKMLLHADELNYDYNNSRVSALGNVQIYHNGSTLEADKVIYDQAAKRLHAEGNVTADRGQRQDHLR